MSQQYIDLSTSPHPIDISRDFDPADNPDNNIPLTTCLLWLRNFGQPQPEVCTDFDLLQLAEYISRDALDLEIPVDVLVAALISLDYTIAVIGGASYTNVNRWASRGLAAQIRYKESRRGGTYKPKHGRKHLVLSPAERDDYQRRRTQ
jgi:hypothetical protein